MLALKARQKLVLCKIMSLGRSKADVNHITRKDDLRTVIATWQRFSLTKSGWLATGLPINNSLYYTYGTEAMGLEKQW